MKNYTLRRLSDQPIIRTADVRPSMPGFQVLGAFNPAACRFNDEIILLLRVAEGPVAEQIEPGWLHIPVLEDADGFPQLVVKRFHEPSTPYDPRVVTLEGTVYLTSISHLRVARSRDGIHFQIDPKPFLFPARADEAFGIEDARITFLEGTYWITYTAVSAHGPAVGLAKTTDFVHVERVGLVLPPPNKDVVLFPERINGKYQMLHRPMVSEIGKPSVWLAESLDGVHWGGHQFVFGPTTHSWESMKIGAGPEPLRTPEGWLVCYHGSDPTHRYGLGLALLDLDTPSRVLYRTDAPLLTPELDWEQNGFFPNVVFTNGWVPQPDGSVLVYYGAADSGVGVCALEWR
ncbi:glycoside hydrolase family 130 protein [Rudanella lutea]|uniref:glycoside hydrolase family 130 protein n=1 Tax=Rudanella lutea TaxID=451374 RepID=UPI0003AA1560|nr:glycoside hydrolase family 130 protein [Rudanella lutea]